MERGQRVRQLEHDAMMLVMIQRGAINKMLGLSAIDPASLPSDQYRIDLEYGGVAFTLECLLEENGTLNPIAREVNKILMAYEKEGPWHIARWWQMLNPRLYISPPWYILHTAGDNPNTQAKLLRVARRRVRSSIDADKGQLGWL